MESCGELLIWTPNTSIQLSIKLKVSRLNNSIVVPNLKENVKKSIENYRPISILNSLEKSFEIMLLNDFTAL